MQITPYAAWPCWFLESVCFLCAHSDLCRPPGQKAGMVSGIREAIGAHRVLFIWRPCPKFRLPLRYRLVMLWMVDQWRTRLSLSRLGIVIAASLSIMTVNGMAQQNSRDLALPGTAKVPDVFTPLLPQEVSLHGGFLGARIDANAKDRMMKVDEDDLLDAFERREAPHQDWQGEHVGKYLHAATLTWNYCHSPDLKLKIDRVVTRLLKTQKPDGYLGTYTEANRWTSWDVWVHKYDLLGLLTYYQFTKLANHDRPNPLGEAALNACRKIGDLLVATFGTEPGKRDINKAGQHVGMAADSVLEPIVLLYRATDDKRYLGFAHYIVDNYNGPGGPAILDSLESKHSVQAVANAKAYEMTSNFNGLLELYRVTGEPRLLRLMQIAWSDIVENHLYLTGSASSFEVFQDKYHLPNQMDANICETCVTVTWEQMNLQLLRLTGDSRCADQLEKSIYNHLFAAQKPTGDDWAYYTPLEGRKPYDSATTCCHSSGPRGVALIPCIAYMASADGGLVVNFYNSGVATAHLKDGEVTVEQATQYPETGDVALTISPARSGHRFPLRLRIPPSAENYHITLNGHPIAPDEIVSKRFGYVVIDRAWKKRDVINLNMTLANRLIVGDHGNEGKAALMHGPLVLALDDAQNPGIASLKRLGLGLGRSETSSAVLHVHTDAARTVFSTLGEAAGQGKAELTLVPYADAGADGRSRFEVWIPLSAPEGGLQSLLDGCPWSASRQGNVRGDITDDDPSTFAVTFNNSKSDQDWYSVTPSKPTTISGVVFAHGHAFHDGGWFDTLGGVHKPQVQIQVEMGGAWQTVATLEGYPNTTAKNPAGLQDGQKFAVKFAPVSVVGVRVIGVPACGDDDSQNFSSCAELQAFSEAR
jgi:DUF1680 family protein